MKKVFLLLLAIPVFISSCEYDNEEDLGFTNCDTSDTRFSSTVSVIINRSCAIPSCHVGGTSLPPLDNYNAVKAQVDNGRLQKRAFIDQDMPPSGPLSDCDIRRIQRWIDRGALNN